MYSMVTMVNNIVLYMQKLLRVDLKKFSSQEKKFVAMCSVGC